MFALPTGKRTLRFALMPPYLNLLNLDRAALEAHPGWKLTRASLREMDRACRDADARLVVMFIPSKSQVYLPLLQRAYTAHELRRALAYSRPRIHGGSTSTGWPGTVWSRTSWWARSARREGIRFLDLTSGLEGAAARGENVYFPDDSHWNARGHQLAAERLARFLAEEPTPLLHPTRP